MPLPLILTGAFAGGASALGARVVASLLAGYARIMSTKLGTWMVAAAVWAGLALGTQTVLVGPVLDQIRGLLENSGLTGTALAVAGALKVDVCCTMILSAVSTRFFIQAGALTLRRRS